MKKKRSRVKINKVLIVLFFFAFLGAIIKLAYVAISPVVDGTNLDDFVSQRNTEKETLYASRGDIYDINGEILAKNVNSYTLSTNGSSFLASLLDKGLTGAKVAEKKGENTFIMDFSPEKLIPSTNNYEEFVEYTKIFCFFICTLLSSMTMSESDKNKLLKNVKILLSNIPAQQSKELKSNQLYMCPVYGQIPAGEPNWAEECIEGYLPIDPNLMNIISPEECYFLKVNGESMNKVISNGAYALIRKTDWVENGEIAVILVNGYDATLKKFTKKGDVVVLEPMSNDPSFQTQIYDKNTPIKIIGKYIGKFEMKN